MFPALLDKKKFRRKQTRFEFSFHKTSLKMDTEPNLEEIIFF